MITKTSRLKQKYILYLMSRNASQNRIGRLMLREDGSRAIEYYYGKMRVLHEQNNYENVARSAILSHLLQIC